jgi:cytochrome c2
MKIINIKKLIIITVFGLGLTIAITFSGCKASQQVSNKSGAQLWAENCQRCHNTPSPSTFSPDQWETVGLHMQSRALLTEEEKNKIVGFLKQQ